MRLSVMAQMDKRSHQWHAAKSIQPDSVLFQSKVQHWNIILRKSLEKFKLMDILQNVWFIIFKFKVMKAEERLRNCFRSEDMKQTWQVRIILDPRFGPFASVGIIGKVSEIWTSSLGVLEQVLLVHFFCTCSTLLEI